MEKNKKNHTDHGKKQEAPDEKNKPASPLPDNDEKINVSKSVFQVNREMQKQKQRELEEKQAMLLRKHELLEKQKQEAYDRRILEEKKELIRLKQGLIEESEVIHEEQKTAVKLSFGKKLTSFIYLNKWWLGIGIVFALILTFLIYSFVTKTEPDAVILYVEYNVDVGEAPGLQEYLSTFAEDKNGDGKVKASVYYIPFSDNTYSNYQLGVDGKMTSQFQSADAVIVIGGKKLSEFLNPESESLMNLEEMFPDNPNVDKCRFMLKNTKFAERIGVSPEYISDDLYLAIRKPMKLYSASKEQMQKTYDRDIEMFKAIIEDLSGE